MTSRDELKAAVLQLATSKTSNLTEQNYQFEQLALEIFRFQASQNNVYKAFLAHLSVEPLAIKRMEQVPCLPIQFFKNHTILTGDVIPQLTFESSGTTGQQNSKHLLADLSFYELLSQITFERFYGKVTDYHFLALLPSYLERSNSSLVYMVQSFIYRSFSNESGFFLDNIDELVKKLKKILSDPNDNRKIVLIGVTFALLDLAESHYDLSFLKNYSDRLIIMETGGMKGRRREMIREEVHAILTQAFGVKKIHSEYGMTELLSQGYSKGDGIFELPPILKVFLREINDPFTYLPSFSLTKQKNETERNRTGGINVIDLANIDTCCFIETQDLGSFSTDYQSFRVMGRFDNSDVRGCNLMVV